MATDWEAVSTAQEMLKEAGVGVIVLWTPEDVLSLGISGDDWPEPYLESDSITEDEYIAALEFLETNAGHISERLTELGWDVLRDLRSES